MPMKKSFLIRHKTLIHLDVIKDSLSKIMTIKVQIRRSVPVTRVRIPIQNPD
jgi:hypothetical protein